MEKGKDRKQREAAGLAALSTLITLEDVTSSSTSDVIAKVAGEGLARAPLGSPPAGQAGGKPGGPSVLQLLERFER